MASPAYRALLEAYAAGVNAGLAALQAPPPEYLVLRQTPAPWQPEDSILTILAMFSTLQGRQAQFEATFGTLADTLSPAMYDVSQRARLGMGRAGHRRTLPASADPCRGREHGYGRRGTERQRNLAI